MSSVVSNSHGPSEDSALLALPSPNAYRVESSSADAETSVIERDREERNFGGEDAVENEDARAAAITSDATSLEGGTLPQVEYDVDEAIQEHESVDSYDAPTVEEPAPVVEPVSEVSQAAREYVQQWANEHASTPGFREGISFGPRSSAGAIEVSSWLQVPRILALLQEKSGADIRLTFPKSEPVDEAVRAEQRAIRDFLRQGHARDFSVLVEQVGSYIENSAQFKSLRADVKWAEMFQSGADWVRAHQVPTQSASKLEVADVITVNAKKLQGKAAQDVIAAVKESVTHGRKTIITITKQESTQDLLRFKLERLLESDPALRTKAEDVEVWVGNGAGSRFGSQSSVTPRADIQVYPLSDFLAQRKRNTRVPGFEAPVIDEESDDLADLNIRWSRETARRATFEEKRDSERTKEWSARSDAATEHPRAPRAEETAQKSWHDYERQESFNSADYEDAEVPGIFSARGFGSVLKQGYYSVRAFVVHGLFRREPEPPISRLWAE